MHKVPYNVVFGAVTNCSNYIITYMEKVALGRRGMVLNHFLTCRSASHHCLHLRSNQEVVGFHFQIVLPSKIDSVFSFFFFYF